MKSPSEREKQNRGGVPPHVPEVGGGGIPPVWKRFRERALRYEVPHEGEEMGV